MHGLPRDERCEEHRELRVPGTSEDFRVGIGDEVSERLTERSFGSFDDRPGGIVAPRNAHSGFLRSLSREDDRDAHSCSPPPR